LHPKRFVDSRVHHHQSIQMTKSLAQIQSQIEQLHKRAEAIRAKEITGVVAKIKVAIAHYDLTPADLFGKASGKKTSARKSTVKRAGRRRGPSPIKYRDEAGNAWTGVGKRPNWFKAAIASGKAAEELLVK
jgi:DNA-binding protein H-NS